MERREGIPTQDTPDMVIRHEVRPEPGVVMPLSRMVHLLVMGAYEMCGRDVSATARALKVQRWTVYRHLKAERDGTAERRRWNVTRGGGR